VAGFTGDGALFVFESYGQTDGEGKGYAEIFIIDVEDNEWEVPPARLTLDPRRLEHMQPAERRAAMLELRAKGWRKLNDALGQRPVGSLFSPTAPLRLKRGPTLTLESAPIQVIKSAHFGADKKKPRFELQLSHLPAKQVELTSHECVGGPMELTLIDKKTRAKRALQKDGKKLPKWRRCAAHYDIHSVYEHKGALAVIVAVTTAGFEGPDVRYMAVTGRLEGADAPPRRHNLRSP
jgi:predicted secreted protein